MTQDTPLISIIIPLYNKEKNITSTLKSVLSQNYKNFEIIVVDDGSTDKSAENVKAIKDMRIKYFYKSNGGVSSARNYGVKVAKGDWILFLDADDILLSECLEKLYNVLISCEVHIDVVSGNYRSIYKNRAKLFNNRKYCGIIPDNYKWYFFNNFSMRTGCTLIRREIIYENPFNESLSRYEDLEFILRILKFAIVYTIPDIVFEYHCDNNALSKAKVSEKHKDFTFSMNFKGKTFWEKCKLGELLYLATFSYPKNTNELRNLYKGYYQYRYIANAIKKTYKLYRLLWF